ncbi:hypothetical protein BJ741DRAFT_630986 [Chytriomyces cf. hyalinus JEL632]|nr:hypothetical protein BJ741DRAFT_630986 [Chytriomyces cf. hyalinus JEL632]
MASLWYAPGLNSPNKDSSEHMHPSHYTASMIDAKSFPPTSKDTDETLSHLLSCLSTAQVIDPTLAPFSSPMSTAPNSRRGSNLDDIMIQQHVHHQHLHRPAMLAQSHEGSFRKMGSQVECAAAIKSLSSLSLSECDAPETQPLTSHRPSSNSGGGVSSTALECIKLNMMGLSVRDETEEESNQDWQHSHRHHRSTRPASASPTRRVHTLLQKTATVRTSNSFSASMPSSYAYDASESSRRHKDSSWRQRVPRTVCNVGTTTVSFADEDVLMCGSTNVLRDDHDARLRRRHPYYRPPLVSAMSRNRSEASAIGELSHALWMRQRE